MSEHTLEAVPAWGAAIQQALTDTDGNFPEPGGVPRALVELWAVLRDLERRVAALEALWEELSTRQSQLAGWMDQHEATTSH